MHNYHSTHDVFPMLGVIGRSSISPYPTGSGWGPGFLLMALGYMEGKPLYDAFNFDLSCVVGCNPGNVQNTTVSNASVKSFLCPSDSGTSVYPNGANYACTVGPQFRWDAGTHGVGAGMFAYPEAWGIRHCTDGSSNTLAVVEMLMGDNTKGSYNGAEQYFNVPWPSGTGAESSGFQGDGVDQVAVNPAGYQNFLKYIVACDQARATNRNGGPQEFNDAMNLWVSARFHYGTATTTLLTPNSPHASCGNYQADDGALASRSRHSGGVNTLFADGSVHFIKDSVSQQTWFSLGTKAGGEIISADSY
jgi:prepilin-type processing-associated H-X9-DG protein